MEYDANSNITGLRRYGMLNDRSFGLNDDLSFEYNGNQRKSVEDDSDAKLTYSRTFSSESKDYLEEDFVLYGFYFRIFAIKAWPLTATLFV